MGWKQLKKPNTGIPVTPGWCLSFVQSAFGTPHVQPTATAAWNNNNNNHKDTKFPSGVAVPVWFAMRGVPAGHVAIRMADGSIYSTSAPNSNRATHHANLQALYSYYGGMLTYRGWSEDICGTRVVQYNKPATSSRKLATVTGANGTNVRKSPSTSAPLAGSKWLPYGATFYYTKIVTGQTIRYGVRISNKWYVSEKGHYLSAINVKG